MQSIATTNNDAIQAVGLSKNFDDHPVLRQINLKVATGESVAIMGSNGSGKTTLLRCLAGMTRLSAGKLWWQGKTAKKEPEARREIGMVAHKSQLYPNLTLEENLLFAARMCRINRPRKEAHDWLDRTGLLPVANWLPGRISHGMRRRVSVARGLIHQPRLILLDEPFSGLDHEGQAWLAELLSDLQKKKQTICFTTHDLQQVRNCADRLFYLQDGVLQESPIEHDLAANHRPLLRVAS